MQAAVEHNLSTSSRMLVDKKMCLLLPMELERGRLREICLNFLITLISLYITFAVYMFTFLIKLY